MNKALITIYIILFINLLIASNKHGTQKEGEVNFWTTLLSAAITLTLFWWAVGWKFI